MIESLKSPEFDAFCREVSEVGRVERSSRKLDEAGDRWPSQQLELMRAAGVYRWFISVEQGGCGWSSRDLVEAYVRMSSACLSSTFILTQRVAALKRIALSPKAALRARLLPRFLTGEQTATVGISHLTTSRRHTEPAMEFRPSGQGGFVLNGFCPWVTGANDVTRVVVGAENENGQQVLAAVLVSSLGVTIDAGFELIALGDTHTGAVHMSDVLVAEEDIIAGPVKDVLASLGSVSTGSFQTSALALGLTASAIGFLENETLNRPNLQPSTEALRAQYVSLLAMLLDAVDGHPVCTNEELRRDANSLVLRATQAAMVAAKGAGFMTGHPVGRWCREAMFFLVWSCPQAVRDANLCELAGVEI